MKKANLKPAALVALLFITTSAFSQDNGPVDGDAGANSIPCVNPATTWYLGGNQLTSVPSLVTCVTCPPPVIVQNNIGTCNDYPFILKANNFQSVWVTQTGKIGINTNTPRAALDVREPNQTASNTSNFRIYGDLAGNVESTTDINMNFATGKNLFFNEGPANGGNNVMSVITGGNVGIGTSAPSKKLSIESNENPTTLGSSITSAIRLSNQFANTFGGRSEIQFGLGQNTNQEIAVIAGEYSDYNNGVGGDIVFGTAKGGAITEKMRINYAGQVWVGKRPTTGIHSNFDFAAPKIVANEMYVFVTGNWADYVFAKDYNLPKLSDVESYYKENHHLPEIPSALEVEKNGIDLAEMNKLLLKKVEELTIYVVELNKEVSKLKEQK